MAKVINSGLPAGSRGLWWFAQGLENLAPVATGDAVLSGATLAGGVIVFDNAADYVRLTTNSNLVLPAGVGSEVTIMAGYRKTDGTDRNSAMFGVHGSETISHHALVPFGDGTVYWDTGGFNDPANRETAAWTNDTSFHVWAFTSGARGHEIWLDGVKIASNAGTGTRVGDASAQVRLGSAITTIGSDLAEMQWFFVHEDQLAEALIADISADPEGELTEEAASFQRAWGARANILIGAGRVA